MNTRIRSQHGSMTVGNCQEKSECFLLGWFVTTLLDQKLSDTPGHFMNIDFGGSTKPLEKKRCFETKNRLQMDIGSIR